MLHLIENKSSPSYYYLSTVVLLLVLHCLPLFKPRPNWANKIPPSLQEKGKRVLTFALADCAQKRPLPAAASLLLCFVFPVLLGSSLALLG